MMQSNGSPPHVKPLEDILTSLYVKDRFESKTRHMKKGIPGDLKGTVCGTMVDQNINMSR
jgi:hypothetical protein